MKNIFNILALNLFFGFIAYAQTPYPSVDLPCDFEEAVYINDSATTVTPIFDISLLPTEPDSVYPPPSNDSRFIFWVHGLGGDNFSWAAAQTNVSFGTSDNTFPARDVIGKSIQYSSGSSTMRQSSASLLSGIIDTHASYQATEDQIQNSMIIAHSQGGIVSRNMVRLAEKYPSDHRVGGIITFGTPHNGAQILNSAFDGTADRFTEWACDLLLHGPITEFIDNNVPGIITLFVSDLNDDIQDLICEEAVAFLSNQIINTWAGEPQTDFYKAGSAELDSLKAYELSGNNSFNPYRVAFYGEETDHGDLIWRTLHFMLNEVNDAENFGNNDDLILKEEMDEMQSWYQNRAEASRVGAQKYKGIGKPLSFLNPLLGLPFRIKYIKKRKQQEAFKRADEFFLDANDRWKVIIGAYKYEKICQIRGVKKERDEFDLTILTEFTENFPDIKDEGRCRMKADKYNNDRTVVVYFAGLANTGELQEISSDGIVTAESAWSMPGLTFPPQKMVGSSHMQMRNDRNTKWALSGMFDGTLEHPTNNDLYNRCNNWMETDVKE